MSIALTSQPSLYAFSGDKIRAGFELTNIYLNQGSFAINTLTSVGNLGSGAQLIFSYGAKRVIMTAAVNPDDSGTEFLAYTGGIPLPAFLQAPYFAANYELSNDFDITWGSTTITFTAKQKGAAYNMLDLVTTPGITPKLRPNLSVRFILYCENATNTGFEQIYNSPLTVTIDNLSGFAEAIIDDKLHTYINDEVFKNLPDIPSANPLVCSKTCRRYYFEFAESYGEPVQIRRRTTSPVYTVLHGKSSYRGRTTRTLSSMLLPGEGFPRFLKQGGQICSTRSNQRQFLYYFNTGESFNSMVMCRLRFTDGTKALITLHSFTVQELRKYGFNVSYDQIFNPEDHSGKSLLAYEIWITDTSDTRMSETQTYLMNYHFLQYPRYFLNWSSWGSMDSRCFSGKAKTGFDLTQSESEKSLQATDAKQGERQVYNVSLRSRAEINTGFLQNRSILIYNRDFFLSPLKFRDTADELLPIKVTSKSIDELEDGNPILFQKFEYEYLFDDHGFTEGDVEEPGLTYDQIDPGFGDQLLTDIEQAYLVTTNNELIAL